MLLERDAELVALRGVIDHALAGSGSLLVVDGPAGAGKSSLLRAATALGRAAGMVVLGALGDELVMESPFAGVRELLWPAVRDLAAAAPDGGRGLRALGLEGAARLAAPVFEDTTREEGARDRVGAVLHGLYWLVSELAERRPLMLLVDDAQWLDAASARFVAYLARRIESLPVLLGAALRSGESEGNELLASLSGLSQVVLHPAPLSEHASGQVVRSVLGPRADEELCRSCHDVTRGNPFYLRALAVALKEEGRPPSPELARRVRTLGGGAIARSVLLRLSRLGSDCERLAEALAILGPTASLRAAAALARLDRGRAGAAADRLHAADLLSAGQSLSFVHPIVHEAVRAELATRRRAALHAEAAKLMAADGAAHDQVATHLLFAEPFGDDWVVEELRRAARRSARPRCPRSRRRLPAPRAHRAAGSRCPAGRPARARPRRGDAAGGSRLHDAARGAAPRG
jgi:hypothetical protein